MWLKRHWKRGLIGFGVVGLLGFIGSAIAQAPSQPTTTYDVITQKDLDQLNSLLLSGTSTEEADRLLTRIIRGAGPIAPLAEIIYKLAQNESDSEKLFQRYQTIVDLYPASAYAQKAVYEIVPLILMSDGALGASCESLIWQKSEKLLAAAGDAVSIPEDPALLQADTTLSLIQLAHFHRDYNRVIDLANRANLQTHQDQIQIALAYSLLQTGEKTRALDTVNQWLGTYPESVLKPYAILILFLAAETEGDRQKAWEMMVESFSNTIEAIQMRGLAAH